MANTKISALTSATTPLAGTEVLPIVQSGATVKVATDDLTVRNFRANATTGILQVTGPEAASTRVMTVPNANFTAARTDAAQSFTGDQTLSTGNLIQGASGRGINFTANTNAPGMSSELFNWYEEGTWTPVLRGSVSDPTVVGTVSGAYTRTGRLVTFTLEVLTSSVTGGSGTLTISGLPFTTIDRTVSGCATVNLVVLMTVPATTAFPSSNTTSISFYVNNYGNTPSTVADLAAGSNFLFVAGQYFV
jgi:hypothetical protein